MITPDRQTTCLHVLAWGDLVDKVNLEQPMPLDRWLVLGVIAQESAGNPCAMRVEPAFWLRYKDGVIADLAKASMARWARFPDVVCASYGLMQVMVVVALERGVRLAYPTSLCDPETGIRAGVLQLRHCFNQISKDSTTPIVEALARYNGGGNPDYPAGVMGWRVDLMEVAKNAA